MASSLGRSAALLVALLVLPLALGDYWAFQFGLYFLYSIAALGVGLCWGLGSDTKYDPGPWEGELRNMWKPTRQPGLWFHGGNLMQSRHFSLYLALQLKARMEGIPTPVFG